MDIISKQQLALGVYDGAYGVMLALLLYEVVEVANVGVVEGDALVFGFLFQCGLE